MAKSCYMAALLLVLCLAADMADTVAQGCVADQDKKIIVIEDYDTNFTKENKYGKPTGKQSTYNVANALIGATPTAGDILRIAFEEKGSDRVAVRIMNVSKQDLMKK
jgi:hypothetical protein